MAIRSRILARHGLVVCQVLGTLTWADLRRNRAWVSGHSAYRSTLALLFDARRVDEIALHPDQIRDHAGFGNTGDTRFRRVAIVVSSDLGFGLARIFQAYASHRYDDTALRVFRDARLAWQWVREGQ